MIIFILLLATLLRFITLNQSLWYDEANNIINARLQDFLKFVFSYSIGDFHPGGYFALLWVWIRIFGSSEIATRSLSVLFGILTVFLTFLIGRKLFNRRVGLISALLLSIAPLHIFYSQEARMYSFAAFAVSLSVYFLIKLKDNRWWGFVGLIFANVLVLYSDYVSYLIIPAEILYIIIWQRESVKKFVIGIFLSAVFLIPWILTFLLQLHEGLKASVESPGWVSVVGGASIKNVGLLISKTIIGRVSFDNKYLYGAIISLAGLFYSFLLIKSFKKMTREVGLLGIWLAIPVILALGISFFIPVFSYFRMIFILPAFYILIARGLEEFPKKLFIPFLSLAVLVSSLSLLGYYLNPSYQREDWKGAISSLNLLADSGSEIVFENDMPFPPYIYYQPNTQNTFSAIKKIPAKNDLDLADFSVLKNKSQLYLFEYFIDITDPNRLVQKKLESLGYKNNQTLNFNGVGFVRIYQR